MDKKSELTKEEYECLGLQDALEYEIVSTYTCETQGCELQGKEHTNSSEDPPHDMLYANSRMKDGTLRIRHLPIKSVCPMCIIEKAVVNESYYHKDTAKFRINTPKAKGDRGKNYYRDFTKDNVSTDPEIGKNFSNKVSKKDEENFAKNMQGKL